MRIQFAIVVAVICALLALVAADPDDTTAMIVRFRPGFSLKSQIGRALVRDLVRLHEREDKPAFRAAVRQTIASDHLNYLVADLSDDAISYLTHNEHVADIEPDAKRQFIPREGERRRLVTDDAAEVPYAAPLFKLVTRDVPTTAQYAAMSKYELVMRDAARNLRGGEASNNTPAGLRRLEVVQQDNAPWSLDRLDSRQPAASGGLDDTYEYDSEAAGADVDIYIVDTGLYTAHEEFPEARVGGGRNFVRGESADNFADCDGHGTHVAASAAGEVYGVAKDAIIWGIRVLDCDGSGYDSDIIQAIAWIEDHSASRPGRRAVINMSLGGSKSRQLDNAVNDASDGGVTVVVASGNEGANACNGSPSGAAKAISVGAADTNDRVASWSNGGTCVNIHSSGVNVRSASISGPTATVVYSGTSMASPHVAGLAARYLSEHPTASPDEVKAALTCLATEGALRGFDAGTPNLLGYYPGDQTPAPGELEEDCEEAGCADDCGPNGVCVGGQCECLCGAGGASCESELAVEVVDTTGSLRGTVRGSTVGADSTVLGSGGEAVFAFKIPARTRWLRLDLCRRRTNFDTMIYAYNTCLSGQTTADAANWYNDDGRPRRCNLSSFLKITRPNVETISVVVTGYRGAEGDFELQWRRRER